MRCFMKNFFIYSLLCSLFLSALNAVDAASSPITTISKTQNSISQDNIYKNDLSQIESYLFGRTYKNDSVYSRMNRIERHLFGRFYSTMSTAKRMNHILANYRDDYNNRNYLADDYYSTRRSPARRIYNRYIGQPTGYTPSIIDNPFNFNNFSPTFSRGFSNNRGYGYNNIVPAMTGAGVHILN